MSQPEPDRTALRSSSTGETRPPASQQTPPRRDPSQQPPSPQQPAPPRSAAPADAQQGAPYGIASAVPPPATSRVRRGINAEIAAQSSRAGLRKAFWFFTTRGVGVLALALGLIGSGIWASYYSLLGIGLALLVAVILELVAVALPARIKVWRSIDPVVVERHGDCFAELTVDGTVSGLVRTTVSDRVGRQSVDVEMNAEAVTYRVPTRRRGLLEIGPLVVSSIGLFGLAMNSRPQGQVDYVRVLPRLVPLVEMARGRRRSAVGADESVEHGGTDLVGLHEYVPGDDLRRLHWATSARTGMLMIRDDADPSTPHLTVVLDDRADHYRVVNEDETEFEDAVEVAFALCHAAIMAGNPLHLVTTSGVIDVPVSERLGAAEVDAQLVYAALAEVQPGEAEDEIRLPSRALDSVAVTSGSEAPVDELALLAGRGATGVVLVVDSEVGESVGSQSGSGGSVSMLRAGDSVRLAQLWDRTIR